MTVLALLALLALFWLAGLGPTLLLMPRSASVPRLVMAPFVGIAAEVLCFFALVPLNLTGTSTATLGMALLTAVTVAGIWKSPPLRDEFREALLVLLVCAGGLLIFGWPYVLADYRQFMGYGNPDVPDLLIRVWFLANHPVRFPDPAHYRGLASGGFVGILFFVYPVALLLRADIRELFFTCAAAAAALGPASVYLLCRLGLQLNRKRSLTIACVATVSSLLAYTFYIGSLGTLTVMVGLPAALALTLYCVRSEHPGAAVLLGVMLSGAFYNYGPGLAAYGAICGPAACASLFARRAGLKRIGWMVFSVVLATVLPNLRYVKGILDTMRALSAGSRLDAGANELQTGFSIVLTERGVPYFWGLANPFSSGWYDNRLLVLIGLLVISSLFVVVVLHSIRPSVKVTPGFRLALTGVVPLIAFFYARGIGYGVFKLIVWIHFALLVALIAALFQAMDQRPPRKYALLSLAAVAVYVVLNGLTTLQLSRFAAGLDGASLSSTPGILLSDMSELDHISPNQPVLVGLADPVVRAWAALFLGAPHPVLQGSLNILDEDFKFLSSLSLSVADSTPLAFLPDCDDREHATLLRTYMLTCADLNAPSYLDWNRKREPGSGILDAVWTSRLFALAKGGVPANTMITARGWYRPERVPGSTIAWQRAGFRWIRKRAEILVIHSDASRKRLHLTLTPGYGTERHDRHVELWMNGKALERFVVDGDRELTSDPFTIPGPVSQLELVVEEDVQPVARQFAMWNTWIPVDARHLNIAVSGLELLSADDESVSATPSEFHFRETGSAWPVQTEGIFADRWVGERAMVKLHVPPGSASMEVKGMLPGNTGYKLPFKVQILSNSGSLGVGEIQHFGEFQFRIPLAPETVRSLGPNPWVRLSPIATFQPSSVGASMDQRQLSFQIQYIGFRPAI